MSLVDLQRQVITMVRRQRAVIFNEEDEYHWGLRALKQFVRGGGVVEAEYHTNLTPETWVARVKEDLYSMLMFVNHLHALEVKIRREGEGVSDRVKACNLSKRETICGRIIMYAIGLVRVMNPTFTPQQDDERRAKRARLCVDIPESVDCPTTPEYVYVE